MMSLKISQVAKVGKPSTWNAEEQLCQSGKATEDQWAGRLYKARQILCLYHEKQYPKSTARSDKDYCISPCA